MPYAFFSDVLLSPANSKFLALYDNLFRGPDLLLLLAACALITWFVWSRKPRNRR